jgi:hypothetical protein
MPHCYRNIQSIAFESIQTRHTDCINPTSPVRGTFITRLNKKKCSSQTLFLETKVLTDCIQDSSIFVSVARLLHIPVIHHAAKDNLATGMPTPADHQHSLLNHLHFRPPSPCILHILLLFHNYNNTNKKQKI